MVAIHKIQFQVNLQQWMWLNLFGIHNIVFGGSVCKAVCPSREKLTFHFYPSACRPHKLMMKNYFSPWFRVIRRVRNEAERSNKSRPKKSETPADAIHQANGLRRSGDQFRGGGWSYRQNWKIYHFAPLWLQLVSENIMFAQILDIFIDAISRHEYMSNFAKQWVRAHFVHIHTD